MKKFLKRVTTDILALILSPVICILVSIGGFGTEGSTKALILYFCIIKIVFFIIYSLELTTRLAKVETFTVNSYLLYVFYVILLIQVSFAIDYTQLIYFDINSFSGIEANSNLLFKFCNMQYFSTVTFATVGYGDISPISLVAKGIVIIEILTSLFVIILIVTNFVSLRDEFKKASSFGKLDELD